MQRALNENWYNAFATPRENSAGAAGTEPSRSLTRSDDYRARPTNGGSSLPAALSPASEDSHDIGAPVLRQTRELERLARENLRLMDRIEAFLELQHREQVLRQQLQNQVDRLSAKLEHPAGPALDRRVVREEARIGVTEEVKPVLLAIVELLERSLARPADQPAPTSLGAALPAEATPAEVVAETDPVEAITEATFVEATTVEVAAVPSGATPSADPAQASDNEPARPSSDEDFLGLPEILTRPLADLTSGRRAPYATSAPVEHPPAPALRLGRAIAGLFRRRDADPVPEPASRDARPGALALSESLP